MPGEYLLAYDAGCGPCSRFKAIVEFLDGRGTIGFLSLKEAEDSGALEGVHPSMRHRSFHLLASGRASSGGEAVLPLVGALLPRGGVVAKALGALPGCERAVSFGYSTLSRLHDSGACGTAAN